MTLFRRLILVLGYGFLYAPIALIIIFSFNSSKLVAMWSGFSWRWYQELFQNVQMLKAFFISLKAAALSATLAVAVGTASAFVIVRHVQWKGRVYLNSLLTIPLIIPDVILGLALMLLFVGIEQILGWPRGRGLVTVTIAHATVSVSYVLIIVRERLLYLDRSLEEAALDLGATPWRVFYKITIPLIMPALVSGWFLAFTLSFDDVVIASFVSGAGSTTLPMLIFSSIRLGISPEINALATILVTVVTLGVIIAGIWLRRRQRVLARAGLEP